MSDPLSAIKSRLKAAPVGQYERNLQFMQYTTDIAKLVAAVELADNRFKEACQCVQRKWPCAFCAARFEINKILEGGE